MYVPTVKKNIWVCDVFDALVFVGVRIKLIDKSKNQCHKISSNYNAKALFIYFWFVGYESFKYD